jgi:hypothetical protein
VDMMQEDEIKEIEMQDHMFLYEILIKIIQQLILEKK